MYRLEGVILDVDSTKIQSGGVPGVAKRVRVPAAKGRQKEPTVHDLWPKLLVSH